MADFNWNDHPIEDTKESNSAFDWNAHPIEKVPPAEAISPARAALVGAGQGATFGFADELTAPVVAAGAMTKSAFDKSIPTLPGEDTLSKFQRLMQAYRDVARQEQQTAQQDQPIAYTGGAIGGSLLTPGLGTAKAMNAVKDAGLIAKTAVGAGIGAGMGGLTGAGESEGDLSQRLAGAEEAAKTGAVVGAAIPVVGQALSTGAKAFNAASELPVISDTVKNFQRGLQGENLVSSAGRREAAANVLDKSGELYKDIKGLQSSVGKKIENAINEASDSGEKVDLTDEVSTVLDKLQKIKSEGSKEAASYAAGVESEIKKILGMKNPQAAEDLSKLPLPEGLNPKMVATQAEAAPQEILVDPKKAQDLKQVLSNYTPKKGMAPQEIEPAGVAKELSSQTSEKLNEVTGLNEPQVTQQNGVEQTMPSLNEQYGAIKDSLKRLGVNERKLPEQIKAKINTVVSGLEKENISGDQARSTIEDVLNNIKETSPEIADKYSKSFDDIVERLNLANKNIRGGETHGFIGTTRALATSAGNLAGLAGNAVGLNKLAPVANAAGGAIKSFTNTMLEAPNMIKGRVASSVENPDMLTKIKSAEPYQLQRKVADASENADPDTLKSQASNIRQKYGNQGEQLATILDNMADKDKDGRRALMFTVLQNQAYRKMLGLTGEEK